MDAVDKETQQVLAAKYLKRCSELYALFYFQWRRNQLSQQRDNPFQKQRGIYLTVPPEAEIQKPSFRSKSRAPFLAMQQQTQTSEQYILKELDQRLAFIEQGLKVRKEHLRKDNQHQQQYYSEHVEPHIKDFLLKYSISEQKMTQYFENQHLDQKFHINSFRDLGWAEPMTYAEVEKLKEKRGDADEPMSFRRPTGAKDMTSVKHLYSKTKLQASTCPRQVFMPKPCVMLRMIRACAAMQQVGRKGPQELEWVSARPATTELEQKRTKAAKRLSSKKSL